MLGTPHYIAPEQARGDKQIDGRADIYSLGATFFHLVTGKTPYDGPTAMAIIAKHMTAAPPDAAVLNAALPLAVAYVIKRMMAKSPGDRHRDCAQLIQDLEQIKAGEVPETMAGAAFERTATLQRGDAASCCPCSIARSIRAMANGPPRTAPSARKRCHLRPCSSPTALRTNIIFVSRLRFKVARQTSTR